MSSACAANVPSATITIGLMRLDLAEEERLAGGDFVGLGVPVLRRTALDDVGDVDVFAREADRLDHLRQQLAGAPDERDPLDVFIAARRLADEHEPRVRIADAKDDLAPAERRELAAGAVAEVGANGWEVFVSLLSRAKALLRPLILGSGACSDR